MVNPISELKKKGITLRKIGSKKGDCLKFDSIKTCHKWKVALDNLDAV